MGFYNAIGFRDRTIFVSQQQRLEVQDLVAQHIHLLFQFLVVHIEVFDTVLQISKPLFLALPAFQSSYVLHAIH